MGQVWCVAAAVDIMLVVIFFAKCFVMRRWFDADADGATAATDWYRSAVSPAPRNNSSISSVHSLGGALGSWDPRLTGAFAQNLHESYKDALALGSVHDGEASEGSTSQPSSPQATTHSHV